MKLPSCVAETDQLLPGGPGSIKSHYDLLWDSLVAQKVKHLPAVQETWVRSLGWEDLLEKEMATHSKTLA